MQALIKLKRNWGSFWMRFLLTMLMLLGSSGLTWAGTVVVPSSFALHRPLNPALITRHDATGVAYGQGMGNRNLFNTAPNNCEIKGYTKCKPDQSDSRLFYTHFNERFYLQVETMRIQKSERNDQTSFSLNYNQFEYDTFVYTAFQAGFFSLGLYRRDTVVRLREYFTDNGGAISSRYKALSTNYGYGTTFRLWDWLFLSYYRDGPILTQFKESRGRDFETFTTEGLRGAGVGLRLDYGGPKERPDEVLFEFYQMLTKSPVTNEKSVLTGIDLEISYYSFIFYGTVIYDQFNNYFKGELLRDGSASFATGVGYNGENFQILFGRDPRFYTGMDGGAMAMLGIQF